jgi:glucosamine 6-phosphate synthetase-like amidotransferase/phosphosugar isomerase protein
MCGIAGFCLNKEECIDAKKLSAALLEGILERGRDATGAAWYNGAKNEVRYTKAPYSAKTFIQTRVPLIPTGVKNVILHTRFATQGSPKNEHNNHPIVVENLVGVHNGHISNDKELLKAYPDHKRIGEVDSEAAFVMAKYAKNPLEVFPDIIGRAALAWIDGDRGRELNLARVSGSPLCVAQTPLGSTIFASTQPILEKAMKKVDLEIEWIAELQEYEYMKVRNGAIVEYTDFKPQWLKDLGKYETIPRAPKYEWDWNDTEVGDEHGGWMQSVM